MTDGKMKRKGGKMKHRDLGVKGVSIWPLDGAWAA